MTGAEHFKEAERLMDWAKEQSFTDDADINRIIEQTFAAAQVHATLALTAATVEAAQLPQHHYAYNPTHPDADVDGEHLIGNPWYDALNRPRRDTEEPLCGCGAHHATHTDGGA